MLPGKLDLNLYRGDDYALTVQMVDAAGAAIDLTGRTYQAHIRAGFDVDAIEPPRAVFAVDEIDLAQGNVRLSLVPLVTTALPYRNVWDLQETGADGSRRTLLAGLCTVDWDVTR